VRELFAESGRRANIDVSNFQIMASNNLNEEKIKLMNDEGHSVDIFAIGTEISVCKVKKLIYYIINKDPT